MTNLINLIVSLILADLYYGRVTGIENLHIQRSVVPFMKRPEGSLAASSLNRFPSVHPSPGSSPNVPSLNGISGIKNGAALPFSQSLRSASLDQPNTLAQNMPGLAPMSQPPQPHPNSIQPSPSLNIPITGQKQDITRSFPLQQAQSSEPSVGPEDNVESAAHEQSMTDQSQAPHQNPGSNDSASQDSGNDISSQPQGSMQMLDLPPLETMAEVPAKSLTTSASKSSDFEEGPLDENTLRSINLEVTKAEPISNSLVGSDVFNAQDQSSENSIPLTQAVNQQPEPPAPLNDPKAPQPNINLSQAVEPAARAINQPGTPIVPVPAPAPAPAPIPITPAPAPPAPPTQPQSPSPLQINMVPQQPPAQQQIAAPEPQPQPNVPINTNEKMQVVNPNNLLNQPPTTVNPPSNPNSPPTSIQPNGQQNQHIPSPSQAPSQPSPPPPPPPATPNPAPSNNPEQTPSQAPQTQETQMPSPTSQQDAQSTNAPPPSPTPDSSNSDSAKPSSSSSSTSYVFKSVRPINTLMDSNARPIASCPAGLLMSLLMLSVGGALFN